MRFGFISPGNMAQAIASHFLTLQQFASEVVPALPETAAAAERGRSRTGERP
jgi:pyrroline-5-carboxylate reductase